MREKSYLFSRKAKVAGKSTTLLPTDILTSWQKVWFREKINFLFYFSLSNYYAGEDEWSIICSYPKDNGQVTCPMFIPPFKYDDKECSLSYEQYYNRTFMSNFTNTNSSCINWNSYYTECKPVGQNPFQKAISFDHTGDAFIAIFQVSIQFIFSNNFSGYINE